MEKGLFNVFTSVVVQWTTTRQDSCNYALCDHRSFLWPREDISPCFHPFIVLTYKDVPLNSSNLLVARKLACVFDEISSIWTPDPIIRQLNTFKRSQILSYRAYFKYRLKFLRDLSKKSFWLNISERNFYSFPCRIKRIGDYWMTNRKKKKKGKICRNFASDKYNIDYKSLNEYNIEQ